MRQQRSDSDPNDTGDAEWGSDLLDEGLRDHYLPLLSPEAVIVELGPGSGRLSRHLIGRCRELVAVDNSRYVCKWMRGYLEGKGRFRVHRISGPRLPLLGDATADAVVAHDVFEHLDLDETYWFLSEFARVLHPGGKCSFNFDSPVTRTGSPSCASSEGRDTADLPPPPPREHPLRRHGGRFRFRQHHADRYPHRLRRSHPVTRAAQG